MDDDRIVEDALQRQFDALRREDVRQTPPFAAMFARAQATADDVSGQAIETVHRASAGSNRSSARPWSPGRILAWSAPFLAAAGLAIVLLQAESAADREFDQLVTEWTRTSAITRHSPTDGLLALPGSEYLRGMPTIDGGLRTPRTRRPS
jgi:hypothetical protein